MKRLIKAWLIFKNPEAVEKGFVYGYAYGQHKARKAQRRDQRRDKNGRFASAGK